MLSVHRKEQLLVSDPAKDSDSLVALTLDGEI